MLAMHILPCRSCTFKRAAPFTIYSTLSCLPQRFCSRQSGYGRYGPPPGMVRGARVIELRQGQSAAESDTWIRLVGVVLWVQDADLPSTKTCSYVWL